MASLTARWALCGVLLAIALLAHAGDVGLVSVTQTKPGEVIARLSLPGGVSPRPADVTLHLDAASAVPAAAIASAPSPQVSTAVLLCLDRSGSMGAEAMHEMQDALREALSPAGGAAALPFSVAIVAFATRPTHLLALTDKPALVASAIDQLTVDRDRNGKTKLYDTVAGGLAELRATDASFRRLLVVSDGDDEGSDIPQQTLIQRATGDSIPVDAIGFGARASASSGSLMTLAGATGGRFTGVNTRAELGAALARMVRQAGAPPQQVDVTFRYTAASDGHPATAPTLAYKPPEGAAVELPVSTGLAAAAAVPNAVPATVPPVPAGGWWATHIAMVQHLAAEVPLFAWIGGGLVLIALIVILVLLWLRRRARAATAPAPSPKQPDSVWSPPQRTLPPARTMAPTVAGPRAHAETVPPPTPPTEPARPPARRDTIVSFRWPTPGGGKPIAILHVTSGPARGRRIEVGTARLRIGAAPDNDVVLEGDDFVSSHHIILRTEMNGLYLVDLGSLNGTDLNGTRFKDSTRSLSPGDRIAIGRTTLEVATADTPHGGHPDLEQRVR